MVEQDLAGLTSRVSTAMIVITVLAVTLRFVARKWAGVALGYDDWFALASLVSETIYSLLCTEDFLTTYYQPFTVAISASFYFGNATPPSCSQSSI
jgi:hypothetical protein